MGFVNRLRGLSRRSRLERELDEELQHHIELKTQEFIDGGMLPDEARYAALRAFGGVEQKKKEGRDADLMRWLEDLIQDLRFGLRQLRRNPGFTAVAVLTLALGIGANTAIFSVINAVLIRPLPYRDSNRLVELMRTNKFGYPQQTITASEFLYWEEHSTAFDGVAAVDSLSAGYNLTSSPLPEHVDGLRVSSDYFRVFGVHPLVGRGFTPDESRPGGPNAVVISHRLWKQLFNERLSIIGQTLSLNGSNYTVVGIMPAGFTSRPAADVWLPLRPVLSPHDNADAYIVVGRLEAGVSAARAREETQRLNAQFRNQYPGPEVGEGATLVNYHKQLTGDIQPALLVLLGATGLLLLIACANVANLLLARAADRTREIAVRLAMGAGRGQLLRQLLVESLVLSLTGGAAGVLLSRPAIDGALALAPMTVPGFSTVNIDASVLLFAVAVAVATGVLSGLAPALAVTRIDLNELLHETGLRVASTKHRSRLRGELVVAEVALSVPLLVGALLLLRTFANLRSVNPGFNPDHVLTMKISLTGSNYNTTRGVWGYLHEALQRVDVLPGVDAAAFAAVLPTERGPNQTFHITGRRELVSGSADYRWDTPDYFRVMKITLIQGRFFNESDSGHSGGVVIINRALARKYFPHEDPIGQQLTIGAGLGRQFADRSRQIVGVVENVHGDGLNRPVQPTIYIPTSQVPDSIMRFANHFLPTSLVLRTKIAPMQLYPAIENALLNANHAEPPFDVRSLTEIMGNSIARQQFEMCLLGIFAALAVTLAALGIYGVTSYSVTQRTHEIGIRMALGAQRGDVLRLVVGQGLRMSVGGVGIGIIAGLTLTRFLSSMLYGVEPTDPLTFVAVSITLSAVALLACYIPARRAAKVDPMVALRYE
jgi:putative ABC transport system permease protein